ncbi:uncharacterized protein LOC129908148 isoform X2 [Episyrphus balteatus]|uniref:uncharacterized protein LOC129908148 isoform X2 n=1 Tax=Episyrphus balteatus TaxID=286459 RepID=UPI00248538EB|nr:uncharacterized protein LOC129908148 isoform X2 [Episyrphus balteatus]
MPTKAAGSFGSTLPAISNGNNDMDQYFIIMARLVAGQINDTVAFEKYNRPLMKSSIKSIYWIFLLQYAILAILGVVMNVSIIVYVMYHKLYKDVTHAFITNLALCHFVQCAVVLPITLTVMMIQNWVFGQFLCFFLPMLQDIPLHVAMISHILIAWDRMRWLSDPMRGRLPAFVCCCATWLTGMVIALPYPIYTMYVELGDYSIHLRGSGLCVINLMDDMHEYMRGLFVLMYCGPTILLAYLYIRTSQELRPPDGPFAIMMFEHRADLRYRQRNSSTSSVERTPGRTNTTAPRPLDIKSSAATRQYDLYNAEMDICREKRKQRNLGSMAATQVVCLCPLMILRLARMVMVETYENAKHFDITFLMFVWIAFLPTVIFPGIYASQILPRNERKRLRGYLRLSARHFRKSRQDSQEESIEKDDNTTTTQTTTIIQNGSCIDNNDGDTIIKQKHHYNRSDSSMIESKDTTIASSAEAIKINVIGGGGGGAGDGMKKTNSRNNGFAGGTTGIHSKMAKSASSRKVSNGLRLASSSAAGSRKGKNSMDSIDNSCSNITASTFCNNSSVLNDTGSGYDGETSSIVSGTIGTIDKDIYFQKKWESVNGVLRRHKDASFSDCGSFSRMDSSSTLNRDLEIIDLLERERSMDIQDMIEREKRDETMRLISGSVSGGSERRRLPDLEKICKSPKLKLDAYSYEKVTSSSATTPKDGPNDVGKIANEACDEFDLVKPSDFFNEEYQPPISAPISHYHHTRRTSRRSNLSNRSKRDSFNSLNNDLMAGTFAELDPTQPLNKMSVIESRMRRSSGRTSSISSSGRSSLKSRDHQPQHSHPDLDFRENIFAEL